MSKDSATPEWGSDAIAETLRATGVPYIALNPGASYRGLHDSLVNHLGDEQPQMLMCLHEEHAVAIAHGYAKVTGRPLAVGLHSNVGLMHASMAIYNAFVDRVPMLILGAAGPLDAVRRRPWIDWIHTTADQPALVRPFIKWDDSPASIDASLEAIARAWDVTRTAPTAPTYVVLDVGVQEQRLSEIPPQPRIRHDADRPPVADAQSVEDAVRLLEVARRPVILAGRLGRGQDDFARRVRLAEVLGARVITDLKTGSTFPATHPLHVPGPGFFLSDAARDALSTADAVLDLDWIDAGGTLRHVPPHGHRPIVSASLDGFVHNGWSKDAFGRIDADVRLLTTPDIAVEQLLSVLGGNPASQTTDDPPPAPADAPDASGRIRLRDLALTLRHVSASASPVLARLPLGWDGDIWPFDGPLDFLGYDGGGGIGSGPGMTIGAALALRGDERPVISVLGDGDYLMGVNALWTAAKYEIPFLAVIANNRSYFNDEVHQERVARQRGRDVGRRWIGQRIDDPAPDLAALARAQGAEGIGPVLDLAELRPILERALAIVRSGRPVVVDVHVDPGYSAQMASGLVRE